MGFGLELVGEGLQLRDPAVAMRQRLLEQPVGEPGIPRQERPMEVRPDGAPDPAALPAALAVIAETCHDTAKGLRTRIQAGSTRVILEAGERMTHAGLELALKQDIADHSGVAGDCV